MKLKFKILFFLILISLTSISYSQCPMCKTAVESSLKDGKSKKGAGLNNGILYLLAMPYIAVGVVGYLWVKNRKKLQLK